jgi:hypothetical protein
MMLDTFTWEGQAPETWPRWLWSKNWATGAGSLNIHTLDGILAVPPGRTIGLLPTYAVALL